MASLLQQGASPSRTVWFSFLPRRLKHLGLEEAPSAGCRFAFPPACSQTEGVAALVIEPQSLPLPHRLCHICQEHCNGQGHVSKSCRAEESHRLFPGHKRGSAMQGQGLGWVAALWPTTVWLGKGFRSPRAELHAPTCQQVLQHHAHMDCLVGRTAAKPVSPGCAEGSAPVSSSLNHTATCTGSGPDQDISKEPQRGG